MNPTRQFYDLPTGRLPRYGTQRYFLLLHGVRFLVSFHSPIPTRLFAPQKNRNTGDKASFRFDVSCSSSPIIKRILTTETNKLVNTTMRRLSVFPIASCPLRSPDESKKESPNPRCRSAAPAWVPTHKVTHSSQFHGPHLPSDYTSVCPTSVTLQQHSAPQTCSY